MSQGYEALRNGAAWLDLSARGKIVATGADRARLLHAMTTNHIQNLEPGMGCYAFFLNAQGRIQADVNLLCFEDHFLLDTEPETRERVYRHLDKYIIADDVALEDATGRIATLGLEGPGSFDTLSLIGLAVPATAFAHATSDEITVQRIAATGAPGVRMFLPSGRKEEIIARIESAGACAANAEEANIVRLEHGVPRYGDDIGEMSLPQETQQMHAVHFEKGCYLGQEIVERIRSRGHVNRLLVGLEIDTSEPPLRGTKILADAGEVGEITSAALSPASGKVYALAYVRAPFAEPGKSLAVSGFPAHVR